MDQLRDNGVSLAAVSMDDYECTEKAKPVSQISYFEILYDLDEEVVEKWVVWLTAAIKRGGSEVLSAASLF